MATLAFTAQRSVASHKANGAQKRVEGYFTLDSSYPDGGYLASTLEALAGLSPYISTINSIQCSGAVGTNLVANAAWDPVNRTLMFGTDAYAESTTGENNLDGLVAHCIIYGN